MSNPTTDGQTFAVLRDLIAKDHAVAPETLTPETPLKSLEIDSLSLIELIFTLEERFDVVADKVPEDLPTLGSVADYIDGLIAARPAANDHGAPAS
ncbi:MAG: phosphopantetheine-binding protein [Pseudoxanthomonas sp.]|nr:phosphopantetheine-binding protein [Pseudoxanthomonas sp.]